MEVLSGTCNECTQSCTFSLASRKLMLSKQWMGGERWEQRALWIQLFSNLVFCWVFCSKLLSAWHCSQVLCVGLTYTFYRKLHSNNYQEHHILSWFLIFMQLMQRKLRYGGPFIKVLVSPTKSLLCYITLHRVWLHVKSGYPVWSSLITTMKRIILQEICSFKIRSSQWLQKNQDRAMLHFARYSFPFMHFFF